MANDDSNFPAPPAGRTRVNRFNQDAEDAANSAATPKPPPVTTGPETGPGIKFFNGHVSTPEIAAKRGKQLNDLLKKRDQASADSDDSDDKSA